MEAVMKETIRYAWGTSTLGSFLVAVSERGVVALEFGSENGSLVEDLKRRFQDADLVMDAASIAGVVVKVTDLIEDPGSRTALVADMRGSDFELRVWEALQRIPVGETTTYGELASGLGLSRSAQYVGAACGANTIAILVPCHRVVKKDGSVSGYRWGVPRKRALLGREHLANFHLTKS
jgi:AraC family transcriptional regulator of adaptative response/methylated-DNA-[protein]-cysteine methyltransferase